MGLSTLIINIAYVALFASTFTRTLPRLRSFLVAAAICFVVFGSLVGNWSMVAWNVVTGVMNARQLIIRAHRRNSLVLTAEDESFRQHWFADLDTFDFASLWLMGENVTVENERLTDFGQENTCTWLIVEGTVDVRPEGDSFHLGAGSLVGEMSLISGAVATADVHAIGPVRLRQWTHLRLETLDELNPRAGRAFHRFMERDLTAKVLR